MINRLLLAAAACLAASAAVAQVGFNGAFPGPGARSAAAVGLKWDSGNCGTGHTLSAADLTDTAPGTDTNCQSTTSKSSGKHYFRLTTSFSTADFGARWAIVANAAGTAFALGTGTNNIMCVPAAPAQVPPWFFNGSDTTADCDSYTPWISGGTQEIAVDFDNGKIWARTVGEANWNNDGTADPATNTGGQSFTLTCPCRIAAGSGATVTGGTFTLVPNTGTLPSGFSYW